MLATKIREDMRSAMAKSDKSVHILKYIVSEFDRRYNLTVEMTDNEVISLIKKYIKAVVDSNKMLNKELSETQKFEINVLEQYLPKEATEEEITSWIKENIVFEENVNKIRYMKNIMSHFAGRVDGNKVKNILMRM